MINRFKDFKTRRAKHCDYLVWPHWFPKTLPPVVQVWLIFFVPRCTTSYSAVLKQVTVSPIYHEIQIMLSIEETYPYLPLHQSLCPLQTLPATIFIVIPLKGSLLKYHTEPLGNLPLEYLPLFPDCLGSRAEIELASSTVITKQKPECRDKGLDLTCGFGCVWKEYSRESSITVREDPSTFHIYTQGKILSPCGHWIESFQKRPETQEAEENHNQASKSQPNCTLESRPESHKDDLTILSVDTLSEHPVCLF